MKGFKFVEDKSVNKCDKCAFNGAGNLCLGAKCGPVARADGKSGYFVLDESAIKCDSDLPTNHIEAYQSVHISTYRFSDTKSKSIQASCNIKSGNIMVWVNLSDGECKNFPSLSDECIAFYNSDKGE